MPLQKVQVVVVVLQLIFPGEAEAVVRQVPQSQGLEVEVEARNDLEVEVVEVLQEHQSFLQVEAEAEGEVRQVRLLGEVVVAEEQIEQGEGVGILPVVQNRPWVIQALVVVEAGEVQQVSMAQREEAQAEEARLVPLQAGVVEDQKELMNWELWGVAEVVLLLQDSEHEEGEAEDQVEQGCDLEVQAGRKPCDLLQMVEVPQIVADCRPLDP